MDTQKFTFSCHICGNTNYLLRQGHARDDNSLLPLECTNCGLVTLSSMGHISQDFYENGHMHDSKPCDPALSISQGEEDSQRRIEQFSQVIQNKNVLDVGCGAGGFLLKARGIAKNVIGVEPEKRLHSFHKAQGLQVFQQLSDVPDEYTPDVVTLFHVLEHIPEQVAFLQEIKACFRKYNEKERVLIIEVPHANDALLTYYKNKSFSEFSYWSCHLYLHTEKTLQRVAYEAGFIPKKIFQYQRYPLANHLYWLAEGMPGGQHIYDIFNDVTLRKEYNLALMRQKLCDTIIGIFVLE